MWQQSLFPSKVKKQKKTKKKKKTNVNPMLIRQLKQNGQAQNR